MLYGEYLIKQKLASIEDVGLALEVQKKSKILLGEIAVSLNFLKKNDADKIGKSQMKSKNLFGEQAVNMGLLSEEQVGKLLEIQKRLCLSIGKIICMQKEYWKKMNADRYFISSHFLTSPLQ
jgi:hypothetical protein